VGAGEDGEVDPFGGKTSQNPLFRASQVSATSDIGNENNIVPTAGDRSSPTPDGKKGKKGSKIDETHEEVFTGFDSVNEEEAKPKKEPMVRDLAGAAEKKKKERAEKLAAMKAKREAAKGDIDKQLLEALAVIDALEE
jgi:hypothetical protein